MLSLDSADAAELALRLVNPLTVSKLQYFAPFDSGLGQRLADRFRGISELEAGSLQDVDLRMLDQLRVLHISDISRATLLPTGITFLFAWNLTFSEELAAKMPNLEEVCLFGADEDSLSGLLQLERLKHTRIRVDLLESEEDIERLKLLPKTCELDLQGRAMSSLLDIIPSAMFYSLREFNGECEDHMDRKDFTHLFSDLARLPNLEHLALSCVELDRCAAVVCTPLRSWRSLQSFTAQGRGAGSVLPFLEEAPHFRWLKLVGSTFRADDDWPVPEFRAMQTVTFEGCCLQTELLFVAANVSFELWHKGRSWWWNKWQFDLEPNLAKAGFQVLE